MTTVARRDRRQAELANRRDTRRTQRSRPTHSRSGRSPMLLLSVGAVVVGIIVIASIFFLRQDSPITDGIIDPIAHTTYSLADGAALGSASAPVTVEVWSDYQCPYCKRFATTWEGPLIDQFVATGQVRLVYRDFAFIGEESIQASIAARCAGNQGQYWQYHDYAFANQSQNGENKGWFSSGRLQGLAQAIGLDLNAFNTCRDDPAVRRAVLDETTQGQARGVSSTPTLAIAGSLNTNFSTYDELAAAVQAALAKTTP